MKDAADCRSCLEAGRKRPGIFTLINHLRNLPRRRHGAARHAVVLTKAGAPSVAWASQDNYAPSATGRIRRGEQGRGYNICGMASKAF